MKRLLAAMCSLVIGCGFNAPAGPPDASSGAGADAGMDSPAGPRCANYQLNFEGHRYRLVGAATSWMSAKGSCEADGGYLFKLNSQNEDGAASVFINDFPEIWIGLSDLDQNGSYVWTDGTPATYARWNSSPPTPGNCAVKNTQGDGRWYPRGCADAKPFVCECDP